ncbi:MAG: hypothetical protein ACLQME_12630 [Alphaproteobacteria bacterium]
MAAGITPLEVMLKTMRMFWRKGEREKAAAIAKDAAPYVHPRLSSASLSGDFGFLTHEEALAELDKEPD